MKQIQETIIRRISLFLIAAVLLSFSPFSHGQETTVKIALIGDSTVTDEAGWGAAFAERFNKKAKVINFAKSGATMQSLSKRVDDLVALKPDYVLIQFGHNDQKRYLPETYRDHLLSYVERIRLAGGKPIIVSSVTRRNFDEKGKIVPATGSRLKAKLTLYAETARSVATELSLPFIDLYRISVDHHNQIGVEASMVYNPKDGDKTHFNDKGAQAVTDLILEEFKKVVPELVRCLK
ncbi:rhamnogalacturonan acetylesterase [Verrucomicrobia bacterium]|nr:rhamnogalacturonan acetylesterase [Verrucomicrobiota bacterium]